MNNENKGSHIWRGMTRDGSARVLVIDSTEIVRTAVALQHTSRTATAALGRLLTAASMIGSLQGEKNDTLTLHVDGDGPIGRMVAVADWIGNVKGCASYPQADLPVREKDGKLDVGGIVGRGSLHVVRDNGAGEPHVGTITLTSGEIAEDIAAYFAESEQIPTLCSVGVLVAKDGTVLGAGGILIQLLPFADEDVITALEANASGLTALSGDFARGVTCEEIAERALSGIEYDAFDDLSVAFLCDCSRERMEKGMKSISKKELLEMLDEEEREHGERVLTTECRFCGKTYPFTEAELGLLP